MAINPVQFILDKREKKSHTPEDIQYFIEGVTSGHIPDYQIGAWLMAAFLNGLDDNEVASLTLAMKNSGWTLNSKELSKPLVDKHSTGGVGDKTTLLIGPLVAAAGLVMPSLAGRALGFTGGTVDKLESIPGFKARLNSQQFLSQLKAVGFAISGQSQEICPADRKLYELRDVTATVDSIPLICASILSKKLAEGLQGLTLDVKCGSGALMKNLSRAEALGQALKNSGEKNGVRTTVFITNMNQPLGRFVGNALEVQECVDILCGRMQPFYEETLDLSLDLAAEMLVQGQVSQNRESARHKVSQILQSGEAYEKWKDLLRAQGANGDEIPKAKFSVELTAPKKAKIAGFDTEKIGWLAIELGAGRIKAEDEIDVTAGFEFLAKTGATLESGQPYLRIFANNKSKIEAVQKKWNHVVCWADANENILNEPLVLRRL